eukprot:2071073-Rhodomonas_salina.2
MSGLRVQVLVEDVEDAPEAEGGDLVDAVPEEKEEKEEKEDGKGEDKWQRAHPKKVKALTAEEAETTPIDQVRQRERETCTCTSTSTSTHTHMQTPPISHRHTATHSHRSGPSCVGPLDADAGFCAVGFRSPQRLALHQRCMLCPMRGCASVCLRLSALCLDLYDRGPDVCLCLCLCLCASLCVSVRLCASGGRAAVQGDAGG